MVRADARAADRAPPQIVAAAVGIAVSAAAPPQSPSRPARTAQGVLVGGELDDVGDAELALELLDRLSRLIGGDPEDVLVREGFPGVETCECSLRGRVGAEDLEELAALLHLGQHGPDVVGLAVPLEVHEVDVLPGAPLGRSRFDLREVELPRREGGGCCRARRARSSSRTGWRSCPGPRGPPAAGRSRGTALSSKGCPRCARGGWAPRRGRGHLGRDPATVGSSFARSAAAVVDGISSTAASGRCVASHCRHWARACGWEQTVLTSLRSDARTTVAARCRASPRR